MSAQDYGGGDNSAGPRQNTSRSRTRRGKSSADPEPQHGASERPLFTRRDHERLVPLEPGDHSALQGRGIRLPGMSRPFPPPPSEFESGSISEDYQWSPQHARTHSSYVPPTYHRPAASFYQPPLLPHHARDQSSSDLYFLQSPQASPNLSQGSFDPMGFHAPTLLGPGHTPPMPMDVHSTSQRPRHTRGGSVSKQSPTRSHRRSRTLASSQSGQLPLLPGFPGPLAPPHRGSGPGIPGPGIQSGPGPSAQSGSGRSPGTASGPSTGPVLGLGLTSAIGGTIEEHAPGQQSRAPFPGPSGPMPMHPAGFNPPLPGLIGERGSPGPPVWSDPSRSTHLSTGSESPDKPTKTRSRRHNRRKTRDSSLSSQRPQQHSAQQSQSSSVLEAGNPMSDFNYSPQGLQYHGLGIGIGGPPPTASMPPPVPGTTPLMHSSASPPIGPFGVYGGNAQRHFGNEPPMAAPALPQQQLEQMGVPSVPLELTPTLYSMPFLPPYVSYEQQLQQQRQLQQEVEHRHQPPPPSLQPGQHQHQQQQQQQQNLWREEEVWPQDYWSPQRHDRPPVPGPSSAPRYHAEPQPMHPGWPGAPRPSSSFSKLSKPGHLSSASTSEVPIGSVGSSGQQPATIPEEPSRAGSEREDPDEQLLDIPGPNYDGSARMDWSLEDVEELMKLLEPAEKYKWRYMSDLLMETRKKRIPLRTCQNKFHALFGETESSSKLHSSLFYVAYRTGWDSIRESSTMREREKEAPQEQPSEGQEENDSEEKEEEDQDNG